MGEMVSMGGDDKMIVFLKVLNSKTIPKLMKTN